jgi:exodeoxyribonuclease III
MYSWNVNGLRAIEKKGFLKWLYREQPDILCLQETKASPEQLTDEMRNPKGYNSFFNSAERKGYSGVVTYVKENIEVESDIKFSEKFDSEGRIVETTFSGISLFNVYFPNGKKDNERLNYKMEFYQFFHQLINYRRDQGNFVIFCGDVNTAHKEIDLEHPKQNSKISGFLPQERAWIDEIIENSWIDTFREFYKQSKQYTWWSVRTGARERNVGWRLDYFFIDKNYRSRLIEAKIHQDIIGSDHCPVSITIKK